MLSAGIVGLPNVGKSTLFNAITNLKVVANNYPFATIEPNVGIVEVKDERLIQLANLIQSEKTVFATFKFVDIAGLVKGASKGEGLGNKFLSNIRDVDCICHVIRCFDNSNITHVSNEINPINDLNAINTELIISDLELIENRIARISKKAQSGDKSAINELEFCKLIQDTLSKNTFASEAIQNNKEISEYAKSYNLLTTKPIIYVANISEEYIKNPDNCTYFSNLKKYLLEHNSNNIIIPISAKIESELSELNEIDKKEMLDALGFKHGSGLDKIIQESYKILNQCTYFTFGKKETRAWTFLKGYKAPQCAGLIHSDFEKGFIKAEIISVADLLKYKSEVKAKEAGKVHLEGKDYVMNDGDVCNFRFNV
ncbi:redox-regulated ATPase YchF [Mycoplasmoides alvi]|uniref:redox-regulated ATPase YchF n=1 Tax=Mycoplasmoides alvi TaxID=78580 RepID=UPI00051C11AA|nr:redox-regulated ATPase YchF [Mycoplasmoides alvi]